MPTSLKSIQKLIDNGQKKQASQQLKLLLKTEPSAQAWYLGALLVDDEAQKIKCLQRALNLDALHTPSNRLINQIQKSPAHQPKQKVDQSVKLANREEKFERIQHQRKQRRYRRGMGCLFSFLIGSIICVVVLSIVGMIPGTIGMMIQMTTGVSPVNEINGTPIEITSEGLLQIVPAFSKPIPKQEVFFIDHGYVNEYTFDVVENGAYGIYLQFLSLNAYNLSENTVLIDANGNNVTSQCLEQKMSEYDSGIAYSCRAHQSGKWAMRIIGIKGETTGGYIVGLQSLES